MNAKELRKKRKEYLARFIEEDIAGIKPYRDLLKEWTMAAEALISEALNNVMADFKSPPRFCILGLGKLGGMELNYSSDIDIIFIYEGDPEVSTRIANRLVRLLGDVTEDGFVFRVDTDLRPLGKQGAIVNTVDALERYYEVSGHGWERQALIRARPVAGDISLGKALIERVAPFVFRRSMDMSALKDIRTSKMALERSAFKEGWRNIKLGPGGIREVEFIVQAFQMLYGGRIEGLRTTNTFDAMGSLLENGIISKKKHEGLESAYILLRRAENLLQAKDDRQTHTLPDGDGLSELAAQLGFDDSHAFIVALDEKRRKVQRYFSELFDSSFEKVEIRQAMEANIETCRNKEEIVDSLPWFKSHVSRRIQEKDLEGKLSMDEVSERLTLLAEVILSEALEIARREVLARYGTARSGNGRSAEMAVLGMGKLGVFEMDYGSDLDLVFIYSGEGHTDGSKRITNREYFTKLAQTVLSMVTLPTRYGKAYNIDTELRPSGNQGALVTSYESFERYHRREASLWERQALIRARVIAGDVTLSNKIESLLTDLVYSSPLPHDATAQIDRLRKKIIKETALPKTQIDLKKGAGGMADIESIVHYLGMMHGGRNASIRSKKLSTVMEAMHNEGLLSENEYLVLSSAMDLFRRVISRVRLFTSSASGTLDTESEHINAVCSSLGYNNKDVLINEIRRSMKGVSDIYSEKLKV